MELVSFHHHGTLHVGVAAPEVSVNQNERPSRCS
jgi:hypothetical protein